MNSFKKCKCRTCKHGGEPQPDTNFYKCNRTYDKKTEYCKECHDALLGRISDKRKIKVQERSLYMPI